MVTPNSTAFGMELHVVRNPNKTYLEMVRARGKFPSAQFRQCTSDLKRGPIHKFIRQLPHPVLINCMGMRPQEAAQRARQEPSSQDEALSKAGRTVFNWLPISRRRWRTCCSDTGKNVFLCTRCTCRSPTETAQAEAIFAGSRAGFASLQRTTICE